MEHSEYHHDQTTNKHVYDHTTVKQRAGEYATWYDVLVGMWYKRKKPVKESKKLHAYHSQQLIHHAVESHGTPQEKMARLHGVMMVSPQGKYYIRKHHDGNPDAFAHAAETKYGRAPDVRWAETQLDARSADHDKAQIIMIVNGAEAEAEAEAERATAAKASGDKVEKVERRQPQRRRVRPLPQSRRPQAWVSPKVYYPTNGYHYEPYPWVPPSHAKRCYYHGPWEARHHHNTNRFGAWYYEPTLGILFQVVGDKQPGEADHSVAMSLDDAAAYVGKK